MKMNGRMADCVAYISSPSNAPPHLAKDNEAIEIIAYVQSENVFLAQYEILNFANAFSVIHMAIMADARSIQTFRTLEAETDTVRKRGQKVPNV